MKSKIIITTIILFLFLFLFPSSAFAGICFPVTQIYLNPETKVEKQIPCEDVLNKFTNIPFSTNSFSKSEVITNGLCGSEVRDISSIEKLTFLDFSTFDKIKIIINVLFAVVLALLPLTLLIIVSKKIKLLWIRIVLDVVLVLGYIPWLGIGSC